MKLDGKKLTLSYGRDGLPLLPTYFFYPILSKFI
jgi:hypothetical protein